MDARAYTKARREGLKAYSAALTAHEDPYLPVLEEKLPTLNQMDRMSLGIHAVPLSRVVGSVSRGRSFAFARNFMPILEPSSEFAAKWIVLQESVAQEGLRDPAKMLEYMGYYYLIEGNKRVSVMKSLDAGYIEADVTRVVPVRTEEPENIAYFEYCAFARESGIYDLFLSRPGDYARLCALPGMRSGAAWSEEEVLSLRKLWHYFAAAYATVIQQRRARRGCVPPLAHRLRLSGCAGSVAGSGHRQRPPHAGGVPPRRGYGFPRHGCPEQGACPLPHLHPLPPLQGQGRLPLHAAHRRLRLELLA